MLKVIGVLILAALHIPAMARVFVYEATAGEKLWLECSPKFGKDICYAKFKGVESAWADKVIRVKKEKDIYRFDYTLDLSDGKHPRTYRLLQGGEHSMDLYVQERDPKEPMSFTLDSKLTKTSQDAKLEEEYKKNKFVPDVD